MCLKNYLIFPAKNIFFLLTVILHLGFMMIMIKKNDKKKNHKVSHASPSHHYSRNLLNFPNEMLHPWTLNSDFI